MKVKIFMDSSTSRLEEQINEWLSYLGTAEIVQISTNLAPVAEKPNDGTFPCVVVTVWYEPPSGEGRTPD